jgi:predicted amidophosphoribosyltransferase
VENNQIMCPKCGYFAQVVRAYKTVLHMQCLRCKEEWKKDPGICSNCGKSNKYLCNGLCEKCYKEIDYDGN